MMAKVYFKGVNVGTLHNSAVKKLKDKKVKLDVRNNAVILTIVEG